MQAVYSDIKALGAELVVLSPELGAHSADMASKQSLTFPIVQDAGLATARAFGLAAAFPDDLIEIYKGFSLDLPKRNGHAAWELPIPARFVIDKSGVVRHASVDPDYTYRPEPAETLAALRSVV